MTRATPPCAAAVSRTWARPMASFSPTRRTPLTRWAASTGEKRSSWAIPVSAASGTARTVISSGPVRFHRRRGRRRSRWDGTDKKWLRYDADARHW